MTPKEFVKEYLPYALASEKKTGIAAAFTLGQAALESGWGRRAPRYNFFGVKARRDTPLQSKQLLITSEVLSRADASFPKIISVTKRASDGKYVYKVKDWFMAYGNATEAFDDHGALFHSVRVYEKALAYKADPYKFAEMIAAAGYATGTGYANELKKVIRMVEKEMA